MLVVIQFENCYHPGYVCETWSQFEEKHGLQKLENKFVGKIFGPK